MAQQRPLGPSVPWALRPLGPSVPWALRPLLLAALLLGIVTMHTLGHPTGGHGGHGDHGGHGGHEGRSAHEVVAQQMPEHHAGAVQRAQPQPQLQTQAQALTTADPAADGMDPMTVCLAVLAGWTLVLLAVCPLLRRSGDAAAEVRARLLRAVRALPPPGGGRVLLNRLSVPRQ
ncbi:hypothetical protein ACH4E7_38855 [Kitasatospora sp. NPDC018058]|uniref:hypothetical protein n=1 Tax=Kitasatospora sp. NPDC018058 TaxID=3364025 RepID=UPI0037C09C17